MCATTVISNGWRAGWQQWDIVEHSETLTVEHNSSPMEDCGVSIHALNGTQGIHTLKVAGNIKGRQIQMLIDTGSTHNFISHSLVKQLGLPTKMGGQMKVQLADGTTTQYGTKVIGLQWEMGGTSFNSDFNTISIGGYDAILGVQWLKEVSPVGFDFSKQEISIHSKGTKIRLKQMQTGNPDFQVVLDKKYIKNQKEQAYFLVQLAAVEALPEHSDPLPSPVQTIINSYEDIFQTPKSLPPTRKEDHLIPIMEGSHPVNLNPYKCPYLQRIEIEKMVKEMLDSGIIRHSSLRMPPQFS